MQDMITFEEVSCNKHIGGVSCIHTIRSTNHRYNRRHVYQIFCNNGNGLMICACERIQILEYDTLYCNLFPFLCKSLIEFHFLAKKSSLSSFQDRET